MFSKNHFLCWFYCLVSILLIISYSWLIMVLGFWTTFEPGAPSLWGNSLPSSTYKNRDLDGWFHTPFSTQVFDLIQESRCTNLYFVHITLMAIQRSGTWERKGYDQEKLWKKRAAFCTWEEQKLRRINCSRWCWQYPCTCFFTKHCSFC